ncbi:MAG TPA: hypothetical protein VGZ25_07485 [Gemmataceae bacterium]|nr:hypothetical protein [Gemmataceae bacterium]
MRRPTSRPTLKSNREKHDKNGQQAASSIPSWQPYLSQYADQRILSFKTPKDLDAAIDLLWTDELRNLPHATPDGKSLVIPAEAVSYFAKAGIRFTADNVLTISDLTAEEIRRLRR